MAEHRGGSGNFAEDREKASDADESPNDFGKNH